MRLVKPLPTASILELTGVDGEQEALLRAVTPHTSSSVQAGCAVGSLVARGGAHGGIG